KGGGGRRGSGDAEMENGAQWCSPPDAGTNKASPPPYLVEIGRFIRATRFEDLPPAVVDRCKRLIADCFAIVTAGNQSEELRTLAASYLKDARPGTSWVIGTPRPAAAPDAGLLPSGSR